MGYRFTLYGSHANENSIVAYCYLHKAALTAHQLKKKECLRKQCNALKKYPDHPYWAERAAKTKAKKLRRRAIK